MVKIALLGSTGSIGQQVLNTVDRHSDKFSIVSLCCYSNVKLLEQQINKYKPLVAGLGDSSLIGKISEVPKNTQIYYGEKSILHCIIEEADIIFVAVVGFCGLEAVKMAIDMKKTVALANKETLVAGGEMIMKLARQNNVNIVPVDSEHSALFQALNFDMQKPFKKLIITASGGAFRDYSIESLDRVTPKDALKHPNWLMGNKITIDCATMVNKGFEVIEASHLYNAPLDKIEVVVHKESVIHSMVEFDDGAIMAQMSYPSMELPIQLALTYPNRLRTDIPTLSLVGKTLHFEEIDKNKYPCFDVVLESFKMGYNYSCSLNAFNEIAVKLFLQEKIPYKSIIKFLEYSLTHTEKLDVTLENLKLTDSEARKRAMSLYMEDKF